MATAIIRLSGSRSPAPPTGREVDVVAVRSRKPPIVLARCRDGVVARILAEALLRMGGHRP